jgi:hypothetical protein
VSDTSLLFKNTQRQFRINQMESVFEKGELLEYREGVPICLLGRYSQCLNGLNVIDIGSGSGELTASILLTGKRNQLTYLDFFNEETQVKLYQYIFETSIDKAISFGKIVSIDINPLVVPPCRDCDDPECPYKKKLAMYKPIIRDISSVSIDDFNHDGVGVDGMMIIWPNTYDLDEKQVDIDAIIRLMPKVIVSMWGYQKHINEKGDISRELVSGSIHFTNTFMSKAKSEMGYQVSYQDIDYSYHTVKEMNIRLIGDRMDYVQNAGELRELIDIGIRFNDLQVLDTIAVIQITVRNDYKIDENILKNIPTGDVAIEINDVSGLITKYEK